MKSNHSCYVIEDLVVQRIYTQFQGGINQQIGPVIVDGGQEQALQFADSAVNWEMSERGLIRYPGYVAAIDSAFAGNPTITGVFEYINPTNGLPQNPDEVRTLRDELVKTLARCAGDPEKIAKEMNRSTVQIQRWLERFALRSEQLLAASSAN